MVVVEWCVVPAVPRIASTNRTGRRRVSPLSLSYGASYPFGVRRRALAYVGGGSYTGGWVDMSDGSTQVKSFMVGLVHGSVSREEAANWAMARLKDESADYSSDANLWAALDRLAGADLQQGPGCISMARRISAPGWPTSMASRRAGADSRTSGDSIRAHRERSYGGEHIQRDALPSAALGVRSECAA